MKELSIEEKAKAYDEALELMQDCIPDKNGFVRVRPEDIFPELKESDERIRKQILSFLKEFEYDHYRNLDFSSWIAWLEKQGKQMSDLRYSILDKLIEADDIYQMSVNNAMVEEAKNKAIEALSKLEISKLLGLEKQGE